MTGENSTTAPKPGYAAIKETVDAIGSALRWGALLIGGLSLLMYTKEIHRFPAGIGLGEGLAFYLVSTAFALYYAVYWVAVSAVGSVVMRWPLELLLKVDRTKKNASKNPTGIPANTNLSPMTGTEVLPFALIGLLLYALVALKSGASWTAVILAPVMQGTMIGLWLILNRRKSFDEASLVILAFDQKKEDERKRQLPLVRRAMLVMLLVMPWLFMPNNSEVVHLAFAAAQLRKEAATVHVKAPWSDLVLKGRQGKPSPLGGEYRQISCVDVLLYGIGDVVVIDQESIREPDKQGKCGLALGGREPKALPSDSVWVE